MPTGQAVPGPSLANTQIQQNPRVSFILTQLNQQGSKVSYGNMLLVPLENSILYVRPMYVSSDSNPAPALKAVVVVAGDRVSVQPTFRQALQELFPGSDPQTAERLVSSLPQSSGGSGTNGSDGSSSTTTTTVPGGSTSTTVPSTGTETVDQLIALAQQAFKDADTALANGDLGGYQAKVKEAQAYIDRANVLLSSSPSSSSQTTVPSTISPTTTIAGTPA